MVVDYQPPYKIASSEATACITVFKDGRRCSYIKEEGSDYCKRCNLLKRRKSSPPKQTSAQEPEGEPPLPPPAKELTPAPEPEPELDLTKKPPAPSVRRRVKKPPPEPQPKKKKQKEPPAPKEPGSKAKVEPGTRVGGGKKPIDRLALEAVKGLPLPKQFRMLSQNGRAALVDKLTAEGGSSNAIALICKTTKNTIVGIWRDYGIRSKQSPGIQGAYKSSSGEVLRIAKEGEPRCNGKLHNRRCPFKCAPDSEYCLYPPHRQLHDKKIATAC